MADGYVLTEKDRDLLKRKLGSLHPWPNIHGEQEPGPDRASDVFVARVQSSLGGISALADDSDNGFYEPGCSMCDLFQIVPGDSTHLYNLIQISGLAVPVFNVSSSIINGEWIVVAMDRHGHWVAITIPHSVDQFYNDSGETVPIAAVMAVTGVHTLDDGTVIPKIGKPSSTFCRSYLLNGATEVPVADAEVDPPTTGIGNYQDSDFRDVLVLYDTGTPAVGEEWGPKSGQWSLSKSGTPSIFTVYGIADSTNKVAFGRVHPIDFVWCELTEALDECGTAEALVVVPDSSGELCGTQWPVIVGDPHNTVAACLLSEENPNTGKLSMPAGSRVWVELCTVTTESSSAVGGYAIAWGKGDCCDQGSQSDSDSSRSDSSKSDSSQSNSSSSQSSESSQSSQSSGSSESSSSGSSGSESSQSSGSSQSSQSSKSESNPSDSQSSKSTAIVPARWSPTGYAALFIAESPEVRFDDVMEVSTTQADCTVVIDPRFVEVCEPDSIRVCSCSPDVPVAVGASVEGGEIQLQFSRTNKKKTVHTVIRLTGIRKGFKGLRFPHRTRRQFLANEKFIKSAYPAEKTK